MKINKFALTFDPYNIFRDAQNYSKDCLFCEPIDGMLLYETVNFRVLLDNFPITAGHILISSKAHYGAAGELPVELLNELLDIKSDLKLWFKNQNAKSLFYEHGRAGTCHADDSSKCEHFHLHCLPLDSCIHDELKQKLQFQPMSNLIEIQELFFAYGNYLFFENSESEMVFYMAQNTLIPPHYLRSELCKALNKIELANWKNFHNAILYLNSYEFTQGIRR